MPKGYVIDAEGIKKLREDHEILRKMMSQMQQKITGTVGAGIRPNSEFVKVTTEIAPRNSTILGKGKAELYKLSKGDNLLVKFEKIIDSEGNATELDVYNTNLVPVAVDSYLRITRNFSSGLWMVGEIETAVARAFGVLTNTGTNVTAYNLSATAVSPHTYITIKKCSLSEDWIVDAEDCV